MVAFVIGIVRGVFARSKRDPAGRTSRSLGILGVSAATFAWGLVPLVIKEVRIPTLAFASYRLWLGVLIYGVVLLATGRRLTWRTIRSCALGGVFFAIDISLSFGAFRLTTVANATIIGALAPVFIALGAARWFGERFGPRDLAFMAASLLGVVLVALGSSGSSEWSLAGDLMAAAGTLSWTSYWLFSKRARRSVSTLEYLATVMLVAAILVTSATAVAGISLAPPRGMDWLWVVLLAAIPGAVGHVMVAWSHRHVEAWLASLITQGQPVVGSAAAWLLLGESLTLLTIVGGVIVLTSTAVIAVREGLASAEHDAESTLAVVEDG
jgi:drug/metabolite transporter (DMT)-like permease